MNSRKTTKDEEREEETESKTKKKKKRKKHRAAMARTGQFSNRSVGKIMLDSGTTSHLTSLQQKLSNSKSTNVPITLAEDSKITDTAAGIREVNWKTDDKDVLSIPSLVDKSIAVLFMPEKPL